MIEVGVDLVEMSEVRRSVDVFGDRYLQRIYTEGELAYADAVGGVQRISRLAVRFAAKEAVIKILRPTEQAVPWRDIEVSRAAGGACEIHLTGMAEELARKRGVGRISVSLSHESAHAIAVAAAESRAQGDPIGPG